MTPNPNVVADAGVTDVELVAAARGSDSAAFVGLFDRHAQTLYRYAFALSGDAEDASRLVRKLFALAWAKRRSIRFAEKSALPWLLASCARLAVGSARRGRMARAPRAAAEGELALVFVAVGELSAVEQQLCALCIGGGRRYRAAAAQLGVTTFTARRRRDDRDRPSDYREVMS